MVAEQHHIGAGGEFRRGCVSQLGRPRMQVGNGRDIAQIESVVGVIVRIGMSRTGSRVAIGGCRCTLHMTFRRARSAARCRSSSLVGA